MAPRKRKTTTTTTTASNSSSKKKGTSKNVVAATAAVGDKNKSIDEDHKNATDAAAGQLTARSSSAAVRTRMRRRFSLG